MATEEERMQWSTRRMLVRHHTQIRSLAAEKRTTMEVIHTEALEIGLEMIRAELALRAQQGEG